MDEEHRNSRDRNRSRVIGDVAETVLKVAENLVAILFSRCIKHALTNFSLYRFHVVTGFDDVRHFEHTKFIGN